MVRSRLSSDQPYASDPKLGTQLINMKFCMGSTRRKFRVDLILGPTGTPRRNQSSEYQLLKSRSSYRKGEGEERGGGEDVQYTAHSDETLSIGVIPLLSTELQTTVQAVLPVN